MGYEHEYLLFHTVATPIWSPLQPIPRSTSHTWAPILYGTSWEHAGLHLGGPPHRWALAPPLESYLTIFVTRWLSNTKMKSVIHWITTVKIFNRENIQSYSIYNNNWQTLFCGPLFWWLGLDSQWGDQPPQEPQCGLQNRNGSGIHFPLICILHPYPSLW